MSDGNWSFLEMIVFNCSDSHLLDIKMISVKAITRLVSVLVIGFICVECHQNHNQPPLYQDGSHQQNQQQQQQHPSGDHHAQLNINKEHVLEHLDHVIDKPKEQMTIDEQNFYYFKLHDYDNNNKLDGLELVSAFAHTDGKWSWNFVMWQVLFFCCFFFLTVIKWGIRD